MRLQLRHDLYGRRPTGPHIDLNRTAAPQAASHSPRLCSQFPATRRNRVTNPEVPNTLIPLADSCRLLGGITRPTLDTLVKREEVTKVTSVAAPSSRQRP